MTTTDFFMVGRGDRYERKRHSKLYSISDRIILKTHGAIDTPNEMVFSKHQYNEARYKNSGFYRLLDSLVLTHTFIFIGCGLSDPDIRLTLENYNFGFPGCRPHYFITAKEAINEDIIKVLKNNCQYKYTYIYQ